MFRQGRKKRMDLKASTCGAAKKSAVEKGQSIGTGPVKRIEDLAQMQENLNHAGDLKRKD